MYTLIVNGTVVTAEKSFKADVLIKDEIIVDVAEKLSVDSARVYDAHGLFVMPAGIDPHVHLDLPMAGTISSDDHYSGGKAAAFGGTTTVIDFVSQHEAGLAESIRLHRQNADPKTCIDYSSHMNITHFNEKVAREITTLPKHGITSIKVFTAYNDRLRINDGDVFKAMRIAGANKLLTMVHAEHGDVIDILVS